MSSDRVPTPLSFADLGFTGPILQAIDETGYCTPTPIQREMIPHVLEGRDVVGQAQTGTGKTAAFTLPLLANLNYKKNKKPQVLVLTPTRELAIQVAESFSTHGKYLENLRVLPIVGGQDYAIQIKQLRRGVEVVVATPGRIMDHIRRGNLQVTNIHSLVLDEADEMLRMGFLDDVEWILDQLPTRKQTVLLSATMLSSIIPIAHKYLNNPTKITIKAKTIAAQTVKQRCLVTNGGFLQKVDSLSRVLETEDFDGVLIFVRTKAQTPELAERLTNLGYSSAPLNGDIQQSQRLRTIENLKGKKIDILVATDVAARGLDVERISHVINFDIPHDTESYIHRIGRTGRAGRRGEAILLINPRERPMLKAIERATKQKIKIMTLPSITKINEKRIKRFKEKINRALQGDTSFYKIFVAEYLRENPVEPQYLAAALAQLAQGNTPLLKTESQVEKVFVHRDKTGKKTKKNNKNKGKTTAVQLPPEEGMERFRIALGKRQGVKPSNIVGAITNEADINSRHIGRISIYEGYSTIDLPYGMPQDIFKLLQRVSIGGGIMNIQRMGKPAKISPKTVGRQRQKDALKKKTHRKACDAGLPI